MASVLTLTMNPAVDKTSVIGRVVPEHKLRCGAPRFDPGGGGINVARVVSRLAPEVEVRAHYVSGGPGGELLGRLMEREQVPAQGYPVRGWVRENLVVGETESGQQYRFGFPGPTLLEEEWAGVLDAVVGMDPVPDYVVASGSLPPGVPDRFFGMLADRLAQRRGDGEAPRLVLDTSGDALTASVQHGSGVFLLKPNLRELALLSGVEEFHDEVEIENRAAALVRQGAAQVVAVSLGPGGALLAWNGSRERLRAPTVPVRSKVGAGDSMTGGIVAGLAQGMSVPEAVRYGLAAGAAAVMAPGSELCRREDVESLFGRVKQTNPMT